MIFFFKQYVTATEYGDLLQSGVLLFFFLIFCIVVFWVYKKPKDYYKEVSDLPLEGHETNIL
ncbi:MAG: CcoQ/FixQ family Cbb3-type cytochrome c oxidase assembly chaperone [Flavobacteriales bacterium Tduv]